jgi:hypothetical protein
VQRAAHQPRLDERLSLPESVSNIRGLAHDPDADLHLGGGHHLGLHSTDVSDHAGQVLLRRVLEQVVALEPEGVHLRPAELCSDARLGFQITVS